jgi:hypothetical protein
MHSCKFILWLQAFNLQDCQQQAARQQQANSKQQQPIASQQQATRQHRNSIAVEFTATTNLQTNGPT